MSGPGRLMGPLMVDVAGLEPTAEDLGVFAHPLVGGLILFTRNFNNKIQLSELIEKIKIEKPEILIAVDYEGGRVQRFRQEFTRVPPMRSLGQLYTRDPESACAVATNVGWLIGAELGELGIDMPLAPVVDLDYGCCSVIGDRAFHRDSEAVTRLSAAFQAGLAQAGMSATAKHFPGHGAVREDSHAELPVDPRSWPELADDIRPYRDLAVSGLASIMMAHIRYPAVDALPASLSAHWIKQILRNDLGFDGAVFCDDLSMGGAAVAGSYTERAQLALAAGCDILPVCNNRAAVLELLDNLTEDDEPSAIRRRAALRRTPQNTDDPARRQRTLTQIQLLENLGRA